MIRTVCLEVHAENPQLPLSTSHVFTGSAASFVIKGVPSGCNGLAIKSVAVVVTSPTGAVSSYGATPSRGNWIVTVPASAIGDISGQITNGIMVVASGTDERGEAVDCWKLGAGDLKVMLPDGSVSPGESYQILKWHDTRPEHPTRGDVAPYDGSVYYWDAIAAEWKLFGGDNIAKKLANVDPESVSLYELVRILKSDDAQSEI